MGEPIKLIIMETERVLKKTKSSEMKKACMTIIALCNEIRKLRDEIDDYKTEREEERI